MRAKNHMIETSHAAIAVSESIGTGMPIVFIHGNSFSKEVFDRQFEGRLARKYRLVAIDLPGHGKSGNAFEPARSYSMPGYAMAVIEVLAALRIERAAVFGWSLGGHVALEMEPRWAGLAGMMLTGAPPVSQDPEGIQRGFRPSPDLLLAGQGDLSDAEVDLFLRAAVGSQADAFLREAVVRTDPAARPTLFANLFAGQASNQRQIAETTEVPLAIVNGAAEPFADTAYIDSLVMPALWEGRQHIIPDVGHMPFREAPAVFDALLDRFVSGLAATAPKPAARHVAA